MSFSSFSFVLCFLPITVIGYWLLREYAPSAWSRGWLILSSAVFFGFYDPKNLLFVFASVIFNYIVAIKISEPEPAPRRLVWLYFGLVTNILFLCAFKYLDFLIGAINSVFGSAIPMSGIPMLLGVSFFTIAQAVWLVDCYQKADRVNGLWSHLGFVMFFPYLISGPIERSVLITKQIETDAKFSTASRMVALGVFLFAIGLAKKLVFGDAFAAIADSGYTSISKISLIEAWISSFAYLFHLYFDFSGYSDMALGCALMVGVSIQQNFNSPLRSTSITDFWRRWHISLSNVITNYLFTPIVRQFKKVDLFASCFATILAMTIAGLWHGPAWTYIVFGLLHGLGLACNQIWRKKFKSIKIPKWLAILITLFFVNFTFVFFRADSMTDAISMLAAMVGVHNSILGISILGTHFPLGLGLIFKPFILGLILIWFGKSSFELATDFKFGRTAAVCTSVLIVLSLFLMNSSVAKKFVYFGF
jgi:alginate O-acetyltransferase complex protein AlgI